MIRKIIFFIASVLSGDLQAQSRPKEALLIRLPNAVSHLQLAPKGRFLAAVDMTENKLMTIDLHLHRAFTVAENADDQLAFTWIFDGARLFHRRIGKDSEGALYSQLAIFDAVSHETLAEERLPYITANPTFDPIDLRLRMLHKGGILTRKMQYAGKRLAKWQHAKRGGLGFWLAAASGMLWVSQEGNKMELMQDDGSGLTSFSLSPDGRSVAWDTKSGRIHVGTSGESNFIDYGHDPAWHPTRPQLVYAGSRRVGEREISTDLKLWASDGQGTWLSDTQASNERYPQWAIDREAILYTREKTTDLFEMTFE